MSPTGLFSKLVSQQRLLQRETVEPHEVRSGYWQKGTFWRLHPPLALASFLFVRPHNTGDKEVTVKDDATLHYAFTTTVDWNIPETVSQKKKTVLPLSCF